MMYLAAALLAMQSALAYNVSSYSMDSLPFKTVDEPHHTLDKRVFRVTCSVNGDGNYDGNPVCFGLEQVNDKSCRDLFQDMVDNSGSYADWTGNCNSNAGRYYCLDTGGGECCLSTTECDYWRAIDLARQLVDQRESQCGSNAIVQCYDQGQTAVFIHDQQNHESIRVTTRDLDKRDCNDDENTIINYIDYDTPVDPKMVSSQICESGSAQYTFTETLTTEVSSSITAGVADVIVAQATVTVSVSESVSNAVSQTIDVQCGDTCGFVYFRPFYRTIRVAICGDQNNVGTVSQPMVDSNGLALGSYYAECA